MSGAGAGPGERASAVGEQVVDAGSWRSAAAGAVAVSGGVDGGPGHGGDAAATAARAAALRQPHDLAADIQDCLTLSRCETAD